ncbi:phosphate-starvation-inducible E [Ferrimonas balearica DSM 9799]|uniref:Protein PsiE n=1 Tax=Ferrimonas balearica (strain DSM 9799 / CCM 4581 / KCTC 23876 / PAT) TaxID=550540 RepID=E1SRP6_FERBD|nr:phosphate-starvation-inducible PsiE family protein [Ferrimonas balearica]MBY6017463.1 phosphate-starvation-inducible PsiE family protein [Halomonas denitrificans]ADN76967.1 phosphate-starvation-inducible E [Ferrimonas balearica DSM 9799]MBW3140038.1 phosphate-starvation-inducible PsiE family protein [Ferrimonas balearica]MBW3165062.1 phosphate-starvation-inducible PsiE family protein [Ferrimonas balearica]MBY5980071.1 phosphate-starvation-inducible PsiE family protein [Ferrimonas balearica]
MNGLYKRFGSKSLKIAEHGILIIISIATLFAIFEEVMLMFNRGSVELGDLLLLFIYLEVLAMVANYAEVGKLPIRMPIYIAIVALARYLILDMKAMDDWRVLAIAFSALVLAAAVIVIRFGQLKLPYPKDNID